MDREAGRRLGLGGEAPENLGGPALCRGQTDLVGAIPGHPVSEPFICPEGDAPDAGTREAQPP